MRIFDTCMVNQELDMAVCRLTELESIPNLVHVFVEADVDHQGHPKPYHFSENLDRLAPWSERLHIVRATGLPSVADNPDPWAREHAQREFTWAALSGLDAQPDDIVLHGDLDEIPTVLAARNVRPRRYMAFGMRMYCFAVDWHHPRPEGRDYWPGTVAAPVGRISTFSEMRDARLFAEVLPNAGWHFTWVGGTDYTVDKLDSFCHPEIAPRTRAGLEQDLFMSQGYHVDGKKLVPVDVDKSWPRWIAEGHAPAAWFRPRDVTETGWIPPSGAPPRISA